MTEERKSFSQQKLQHRIGIDLRLLDIGDLRGIEDGDLRASDVLVDKLVDLERRCRVMFARDHECGCADLCEQRAVIHVADAFAAADITLRFGGQEHLAHPRHRLRIEVAEFLGEPALHIGIDDRGQTFFAHGLEPALPQRFVGEIG